MSGKAQKRSAFYQSVDQQFYEQAKKSNGGKLPADLVGPDGQPRPLTRSAKDAKYRQSWSQIADQNRQSKAVDKPVGTCKACQSKSKGKHAPAVSQVPPEPKPQDIPCKHGNWEVKCSHGHRGFSLKGNAGEPAAPAMVLSVLADVNAGIFGDSVEKITATAQTLAGPCPTHNLKVFDFSPEDPLEESGLRMNNSQLDVRCIAISPGVSSISDALKILWPRSVETRDYQITIQTCQGKKVAATIRTYPQIEWSVSFKFGTVQTSTFDARGDSEAEDEYTAEIEAELKLTGKTYKLGVEFKDKVKALVEYFNKAHCLYKHVAGLAQKLGGAEITVTAPSCSVVGKWGWKEIDKSPECGFEVGTKLVFDPAIGVKGKVDVLPALSDCVPPLRALLDSLLFTYGDHFKASIEFSAGAQVGGELSFNKTLDKENFDITGEITGKVPLQLEGITQVKGDVFFLSGAAGLKIGAKSAVSISGKGGDDDEGLFVGGKIGFNGLTVYAEAYASLTFSWSDPPDEDSGDKPDSAKPSGSAAKEWSVWSGLTLDGTHHFVQNHSGS
jgi:hypothetical protein